MEDVQEPVKKNRWVVVLLWLVPAWLVVSAGAGIWMYLQAKKEQERKESIKFAKAVSATSIADDLRKLDNLIGLRNPAVNQGDGLTRAASWIEGTLGPSNTGYNVKQIPGPDRWPILKASLRGTDENAPSLWVVSSYDTPAESNLENPKPGTAVVAEIAAAQAIAGEQFATTVHFVFLPHGNDPSVLQKACRDKLVEVIRENGPSLSVLVLSDMGGGQFVDVSTRDTTNRVLSIVPKSFGTVHPPQASQDLSNTLHEAGQPAVRVSSTRAEEPDKDELTPLTGQLVELIRRLASKK